MFYKKKAVICCTMTAAVFSMALAGTAFADEGSVWSYRAVADSLEGVNIRADASETSAIVGYLPCGGVADVIQGGDEWSLVISGGVQGYVKNEYLALGADAASLAGVYGYEGVKTDWDGVHLFTQPDGASQVVDTASAGEEYTVIEDQGDWLSVQASDGTIAYVASEDVKPTVVLQKATAAETATGTASDTGDTYTGTDSFAGAYGADSYTDSAYTDSSYSTEGSAGTGYDTSYDTGYDTSYDSSYDTGYDTSYDSGYDAGYDMSYDSSYDTGYDTSYDSSYDTGYDTSYDSSYTDGSAGTGYDTSTDATYETEAPAEDTSAGTSSGTESGTSASSSDLDLLAALIYCEAGNQSRDGKVAVGAVVMNRVASGSFAGTISGVIYESGQFTPAMTGWLDQVLASGAPSDCYEAAQAALNGENPVGGALYFNVGSGKGIQIGAHQFY